MIGDNVNKIHPLESSEMIRKLKRYEEREKDPERTRERMRKAQEKRDRKHGKEITS